jgi:hypothetical protein
MCDEHEPRLERWIRRLHNWSRFTRAVTTFVEDLTVLADRTRLLVITMTFVGLAVVASLKLL